MAGVFFVVCIPTANYEHIIMYGTSIKDKENNENIIQLDVELRRKNSVRQMVSKMEENNFTKVENLDSSWNSCKKVKLDNVPMEKVKINCTLTEYIIGINELLLIEFR